MESLKSGWVGVHGGCNEKGRKNDPSHSPWKREEMEKKKVGGGWWEKIK